MCALAGSASATDYATPAEVLAAIDAAESTVALRLRAIQRHLPAAGTFCNAVLMVHARHLADRSALRRRLGVAAAPAAASGSRTDEPGLEGLRAAQQALVYAHAEGLPALGDAGAVALLAGHIVTLAQQLTVIQMWIELEEARG